MPALDCSRCGESFDTERQPAVPGADTSRCPACGQQHELDDTATEGDRQSPATATASADTDNSDDSDDGVTVEIHVHE
jgi:predicted  nucleic acid-binding Zn-ribbon protein